MSKKGIRLRDLPYRAQRSGPSGGVKTKIPVRWAKLHGWEPGDLICLGFKNNQMTASKTFLNGVSQSGKYSIGKDYTIHIPTGIRRALDIIDGSNIIIYSDKTTLLYEKETEDGKETA